MMTDLRIRVDLSDFVSGLNAMRWMHLSSDKVSMVADLVNLIREQYEEVQAEDSVNLFLDGFSLPSWEPVKILKNGDLVKGFLSKGNTSKRQLSGADNERYSPKKRKKLDSNIKKVDLGVAVSDTGKIKSQNASAAKKEMAKKNETSSSSSSSSSSEDEGNVKIPPKKETPKQLKSMEASKTQKVEQMNSKKDSSTSSSSSSEDEKGKKTKVPNKNVATVTTKIPVAALLKTGNVSSSSDDSSSSSEDDQPIQKKTLKNDPPSKLLATQKQDSSSSSDSSSDSESQEPVNKKVIQAPKNSQISNDPTKPKRKRKRKNKNKNKLPANEMAPAQHLSQPVPMPMRWQNCQSSAPQNNHIVFDDEAPMETPIEETFTAEQIQELYKLSKPAKTMASPRPDLLPKINGLQNGTVKAPIGPSLGSCEAAILSSQAKMTNHPKPTPRIVFRPSVVSFTNGVSAPESKTESPESSQVNGFSSLLNGKGTLYSRSEKSAKQQQLNDVQTNVSMVVTNPVNGDVSDQAEDTGASHNKETMKDYSVFHPVSGGGPRKGDIIAYKMVEISDNYTPELSEYQEGKVVEWDGKKKVTLELINKQIKKREGRFEVEGMTDDVNYVREFCWDELIEPRLIFP